MKGHRLSYSAVELQWIEAHSTMPRSEMYAAFQREFSRPDVSQQNLTALCKRQGWLTGRTGQFNKGQEPLNKGRKCAPGTGGLHPNARKTQFKKGHAPLNYRGPGHERIDNKDGFVILIVEETNPWSGAGTRPVHKHRWLWEKQNGPVPEGHVLKCLDGDKTNTDPCNWEAVPRALLPRLNGRFGRGYDAAPTQIKPTIMAVTKLEHAARGSRRGRGR